MLSNENIDRCSPRCPLESSLAVTAVTKQGDVIMLGREKGKGWAAF